MSSRSAHLVVLVGLVLPLVASFPVSAQLLEPEMLHARLAVRPVVSETVPFADAAAAVQRLADGATTGRLVVAVGE